MQKQGAPFKGEKGDLIDTLQVAVGARVMLTRNIDVQDGLVNGCFGTVAKIITQTHNSVPVVQTIGLELDNTDAGQKHRNKVCGGSDNIVYIEREEESLRKKGTVQRQFPLKLAFACTAHKVQGMTTHCAVVSLKKVFEPVLASHAQDDLRHDGFSRGVQCTCNSLVFLAVLGENDRLNGLDLDRVLAKGDALYTRVKRALLNEGRFVCDLLTFDELPGTVETDSRCYSVIKHPQRFGLLKDEAPQGMAEYETLDRALRCLTGDAPTALLMTGATCIAVFRDRAGRFGFFDPHCRTPDGLTAAEHMGTAVMLTFPNLEDLIERLLILYHACLELNDSQQYDLPVSFVNRDTATTADAQGKLSYEIQTIVDPGVKTEDDQQTQEERTRTDVHGCGFSSRR
ncbi:hypothetical protein SRHO_G00031550 [Serrasalmus rhombeus]